MIGWLVKLIPAPYRIGVALAGVAVVAAGSSWVGWTARDYFADRKELRASQREVKRLTELAGSWERAARGWEATVEAQNELAAKAAEERAASQARADKLAQEVIAAKAKLTKLEKARVEDGGMCERTSECHWLLFNAAVRGEPAPLQCTQADGVRD